MKWDSLPHMLWKFTASMLYNVLTNLPHFLSRICTLLRTFTFFSTKFLSYIGKILENCGKQILIIEYFVALEFFIHRQLRWDCNVKRWITRAKNAYIKICEKVIVNRNFYSAILQVNHRGHNWKRTLQNENISCIFENKMKDSIKFNRYWL